MEGTNKRFLVALGISLFFGEILVLTGLLDFTLGQFIKHLTFIGLPPDSPYSVPLSYLAVWMLPVGGYYAWTWWRHGRNPPAIVWYPRYRAPEQLPPSLARLIWLDGFDNRVQSLAILDLVLRGYLSLTGEFRRRNEDFTIDDLNRFTLELVSIQNVPQRDQALLQALFTNSFLYKRCRQEIPNCELPPLKPGMKLILDASLSTHTRNSTEVDKYETKARLGNFLDAMFNHDVSAFRKGLSDFRRYSIVGAGLVWGLGTSLSTSLFNHVLDSKHLSAIPHLFIIVFILFYALFSTFYMRMVGHPFPGRRQRYIVGIILMSLLLFFVLLPAFDYLEYGKAITLILLMFLMAWVPNLMDFLLRRPLRAVEPTLRWLHAHREYLDKTWDGQPCRPVRGRMTIEVREDDVWALALGLPWERAPCLRRFHEVHESIISTYVVD